MTDQEDWNKFTEQFGVQYLGKDYVSLVILCASYLDDLLRELLSKALLPDPKSADDLFDPDREIGAFGSKIRLVESMGLLDARFISALKGMQKGTQLYYPVIGQRDAAMLDGKWAMS
jgi:hypothetical protein